MAAVVLADLDGDQRHLRRDRRDLLVPAAGVVAPAEVVAVPGHAQIAGDLVRLTRLFGLSLGDRACLALGMDLGVPVYTADRAWKELRLPVQINVIR